MRFISITGSNDQVLSALEGYRSRHELFDQGLDELTTVTRYLAAFGVPEVNFAVDLTIARGLDYYRILQVHRLSADRLCERSYILPHF